MAANHTSGAGVSRNPHPPDLQAQISGMLPVAIRVAMEPDLESGAIELRIRTGARRTDGLAQLLLTPADTIDLAARLAGTVERWRAQQARGRRGEHEDRPHKSWRCCCLCCSPPFCCFGG
jgi:hypothetical protein